MQKPSEELIQKARQAHSPEEIAALAEANGTSITGGRAAELYERTHKTGEIADEELDSVAGGCGSAKTCAWCGGVVDVYPEGDYCRDCGRQC